MAKSRNKRAKLLMLMMLSLLSVNAYCLWRLHSIADAFNLPLLGSFSEGFAQIAMIILINSIVIVFLLVTRKR